MPDSLRLRGGTTAQHSTFTGALKEVTVDTDKDTLVVHDGATAGGFPLARQNLNNVADITADLLTATDNAKDLGSASKQWRNVYFGTGLFYKNHKLQVFLFAIKNDGGTLKHAFFVNGNLGTAAALIDKINGASGTLTASPTGSDASTAMANGGKISSADTSRFILDTGAITDQASSTGIVGVVTTDTGTAVAVELQVENIDVNGTARNRIILRFKNQTSGAVFNLNTTNIASGKIILVPVLIFLP